MTNLPGSQIFKSIGNWWLQMPVAPNSACSPSPLPPSSAQHLPSSLSSSPSCVSHPPTTMPHSADRSPVWREAGTGVTLQMLYPWKWRWASLPCSKTCLSKWPSGSEETHTGLCTALEWGGLQKALEDAWEGGSAPPRNPGAQLRCRLLTIPPQQRLRAQASPPSLSL